MNRIAQSISGIETGTSKCEQCGTTTRLGDGMCVTCCLKQGLEEEKQESIAAFETVLAEADVPDKQWRLGNYEIIEEIGRGGMGVIYRARQRHSRRIVALKRMLTYHADSHETLARFRREAETAATLDHPNILPIYEVSETEDGLPFFSMKLATAGSLRTASPILRNESRQCVQLIAKVARAIDYAHGHGVLHRDLQPGNILLDARGEPMVSDFGLAKWLSEESDLTRTLTTFGTPGYIAPEQAEGGDFSPAADIYSLGAVLFNLLASRPPFVGANALSVIRQAAATPAPKLRAFVPLLGRDLETIIARCLERDPRARYKTAGALAEDLERWLEGRPIIARPIRPPARLWRWSRRNPVLAGVATASALLAIAVVWLLREQFGSPPRNLPPPEKSIAVLPFQNLSRDSENAFFTDGVQDEILSSLAEVADLKVISRTSVMPYKDIAKRNLREISQQLGVANLLEGSVQRTANRVRVNAQLIDTRSNTHLWAQTYDGDLNDVFGIQSQIAKAIADQLRAVISEREKAALAKSPTTDFEANILYQKALSAELADVGGKDLHEAIRLLEQAIARDPNFLLARCALSRMHLWLYYVGFDHTPARRDMAKTALDEAARLQPDAGELHLATAGYWLLGSSDYDRARTELELARRSLPNNSKVYLWSGAVDRRQGRWSEAIRNFERAVELDPRDQESLMNCGFLYEGLHRYSDATRMYERAAALSPPDYLPRIAARGFEPLNERADTRPLRGELNAILAENPKVTPKIADHLWFCARMERDRAELERALAAIPPDGIPVGSNIVRPHDWFVGYSARLFGDKEKATIAFTSARAILEKTVREQPDRAQAWSLLGRVDAALGRKEEAVREGREACKLSAQDAWSSPGLLRALAEIYAWTGEKELALEQLETLAAQNPGLDYGDLKLDPDWDSLRSDPRFEALVAQLSPEAKSAALTGNAIPEKSIAVLPFENLNGSKENSYFAAGIQDDVLTSLAQIHDLKVISRTSVMSYQNPGGRNMREISRALGVANVLEGSIRRAGNRVLVNVQLIDAPNDRHLWAERYDRTVTDSIGLQGELARQIATALKAKLAPEEKARLDTRPTTNSEAYMLYLTALGREGAINQSTEDEIAAEQLYMQATALDPGFALAYAQASMVNSGVATGMSGDQRTRKAKARAQAEEALRLSPTLGEAHMALGLCLYFGEKNYDAALKEFAVSAAASPNNAEIYNYVGGIYRRQGRWRESVASFERALSLDPRNRHIAMVAANNHLWARDWPAAAACYNRALEIAPDGAGAKIGLAYLEVFQNGNPAAGSKILQNIPAGPDPDGYVALARWDLAMLERDYATAEKIVTDSPLEEFPDAPKTFYQGCVALARGDIEPAHRYFAAATPVMEKRVRDDPGDADRHAALGLLYAYMQRKEEASRESRRAIELEPESENAFHGPLYAANLALVYALVGEPDQAITLIERLLSTPGAVTYPDYPSSITLAELRLRWEWDSLRSNSRFQKILAGPEPKTILLPVQEVAPATPEKSVPVLRSKFK